MASGCGRMRGGGEGAVSQASPVRRRPGGVVAGGWTASGVGDGFGLRRLVLQLEQCTNAPPRVTEKLLRLTGEGHVRRFSGA